MPFPEKLTEIMLEHKLTSKELSEATRKELSTSLINSFRRGLSTPTPRQISVLNMILGIDMELFLNDTPKHQVPTRKLGIQITEFGKISKIDKPGKPVKSSKIKNSITRIHKIPKPGYFICSHCRQERIDCDYAHPEDDEIKLMFGNPGTAGKSPDEIVALICFDCKKIFDTKPNKNASRLIKLEHAMLWSKAIIFSQAMRIAALENKK